MLEWLPGDQLQDLAELTVLKASNNKIASLAAGAVVGSKLRELYLDGNLLEDLPSALGNAKALNVLELKGNNFSGDIAAAVGAGGGAGGGGGGVRGNGGDGDGDGSSSSSSGKDALFQILAERYEKEEAYRKHKEAYPDSIMAGIFASIGRPGINPGLVKAGMVIYFLLFLVVLLQFVLMGPSIHVFIMFVLAGGLSAGLFWYTAEVMALQNEGKIGGPEAVPPPLKTKEAKSGKAE